MPKILVVANDPAHCAHVAASFDAAGFETSTTPRLKQLSPGFDVVVCALNSSDENFEFCRGLVDSACPPVVVWVDRIDPANVLRGLAAGAAGIIPFDLDPAELGRRVRRILARPAGPKPSEQVVELGGEKHSIRATSARLADELVMALEDLGRVNHRFAAELAQRWRAEEEALRSRERFELAVQGSGDGLWDWDLVTNEVYFSPRWKEMIGYADHEIAGMFNEWASRLHPDDVERATATIDAYLSGNSPVYELEHRLRHKDGSYRWILARGAALRDGEGRPYRMSGSHTNLTARKAAEEELRHAKDTAENAHRLINSILLSLTDGIVVADRDGKFIHFNAEAERILGIGALEAPVGEWSDRYGVFRPDGVTLCPPEELPLARAMRGESVADCELIIRNPRKPEGVWISINGRPLCDQSGAQNGGVVAFRNITERKRAEAELHRAKMAAEAANQAKSEFLANMSHEIRTPMNAIIGMAELLSDTELAPDQRDYLDMVRKSADALLGLINDILDFSKIEAGRLDLEETDFSLRDSLADTLTTLSLRAYQKGLELAFQVAADVPDNLTGDPNRLRQIVTNLVGNAVKFTEEGEVVVEVDRVSDNTTNDIFLHFAVRDTGIGIPAEKQSVIFEAFTQADSSMTRRYGGTGLGLAISTRLVRLMSGRIWVTSQIGRGSTFHFTARFRPAAKPITGRTVEEATKLRGARVLVVDDNETNRRILEETLKQWEMAPTMADGAAAALAALDRLGPDPFTFVLLDAHMPGTDGFELARLIRRRPDAAAVKILMLTSGGQPGDASRSQELGFSAYLAKPLKQADLWRALIRALDVSSGAPLPATPVEPPRPATRPLRVLLAEDNPINQKLAVRLLEKRGHTVVVAGNGCEAIDLVFGERAVTPFDVVLMDVQMPEMDGLEATAAIRKHESTSGGHLPIVAMTAHAMKGDEDRCLACGMDAYIPKPVKPDALFNVLTRLARKESSVTVALAADGALLKLIDWNEALAHVRGDVDLLRELAGIFLSEWGHWSGELAAGVAAGDAQLVRRTAHTIKGSLGTFAATNAYRAAQDLESQAESCSLKVVPPAFDRLQRDLQELLPPLTVFAKGGPP
ncbi:MAG TPA: response regulator [Gemmataceae bacterium]|jgi:PAS domain S-box-containing protein|nr:response regulator [Gemmataceae bacterium]